jgi:pimeloyl-ACP methyl ester carboxylesterase
MLEFVLPVSLRRQGLLNDGEVTTTLQRYALERIRAPTLMISTQDDLYGTFERARYTAAEIPDARFVGYPSGGHLMVGRDAENTAAMLSLLRQSQTPF